MDRKSDMSSVGLAGLGSFVAGVFFHMKAVAHEALVNPDDDQAVRLMKLLRVTSEWMIWGGLAAVIFAALGYWGLRKGKDGKRE